MADLNQNLYTASYEALTNIGIPEPLADAASRVVATDDPNQPDLGRNDADIQVCQTVAEIYTRINQQGAT